MNEKADKILDLEKARVLFYAGHLTMSVVEPYPVGKGFIMRIFNKFGEEEGKLTKNRTRYIKTYVNRETAIGDSEKIGFEETTVVRGNLLL